MAAAGDDAVSGQAVLYMVLLAVQFGTQPLLNASFLPRGIIRTTPVLVGEVGDARRETAWSGSQTEGNRSLCRRLTFTHS